MKNMSGSLKTLLVIFSFVILVVAGFVFVLYYWSGKIEPGNPGIDVELDSKKVNNTYVVTVTDVHLDDKIYLPNGDEFHGDPMLIKHYRYLISTSGCDGHYTPGVWGNVTDALEANGNITFHDADKDGKISVGDEFVIDENVLDSDIFDSTRSPVFFLVWEPSDYSVGQILLIG